MQYMSDIIILYIDWHCYFSSELLRMDRVTYVVDVIFSGFTQAVGLTVYRSGFPSKYQCKEQCLP